MDKIELTENWLELIPNMVSFAKRTFYQNGMRIREKGRIAEFEPFIILSPEHAAEYAISVIQDRWFEAEENISTCSDASINYAKRVIQGRWEQGEAAIARDARNSLAYAKLLKAPFPLGEAAIAQDAKLSFAYAREVLYPSRFEKGEEAIAKGDLECHDLGIGKEKYKLSIDYYYLMKERGNPWTEDSLKLSPCWMYLYAKEELKGRLPDSLHNTMMLFGLRYKNDYYVKKYLGAKKYTKKVKRRTKKSTLDIASEIVENFSSKE